MQYKKDQEDKLFRAYVANTVYYLSHGKAIETSYTDLINSNGKDEQEERSAEEIKESLKTGLNQIFREGGNKIDGSNVAGSNTFP